MEARTASEEYDRDYARIAFFLNLCVDDIRKIRFLIK